ncbi:DUF3918 family protein [Fictibacillus aquaticus]|uniref:DUF3918 family protein n=1 Tax=Fictibacillus aquaticus TaxID=2021314 RepID=UPI000D093174|nr:DUF3918 family protein [Fictibacillus aquaticus]
MNRSFTSLLALGIGAAAMAMNKRQSRGRSLGMMMAMDDMWRSRTIRKMRKKIAKAIY